MRIVPWRLPLFLLLAAQPFAPPLSAGGEAAQSQPLPAEVEIAVRFSGEAIGLNDPALAQGSAGQGIFTITASGWADAHLVSEPLLFARGQRYRISCEAQAGNLAGSSQGHAGGVGFRGERMLLEFPPGSYNWRPFSAVYTPEKSTQFRLTVGIGGWKQGRGNLLVRNLRVELLF